MSGHMGFFALVIPVPVWFASLMVLLMLGMNYLVNAQLRNVRWFYENRPAHHDDDLCICGHAWDMHLNAKANHRCAWAECRCATFREPASAVVSGRSNE